MRHPGQAEVVNIGESPGALRGHVRARQRLSDDRVAGRILHRRLGIELEVEAAARDEIGEADSRASALAADLAVGGDKIIGGRVEPLRGELDQRLARGRRGLPNLHSAALDAIRAGRASLVGRERRVALDIVDHIDADAELLGDDLTHGDP